MSNPAAHLKACGRLTGVTLSNLDNASITPADVTVSRDTASCLHPDYLDLELATAEPDDVRQAFKGTFDAAMCDTIQTMHRRWAAAVGRGSWPPGNKCHPDAYPRKDYHATTYYIQHDQFLQNRSLHREVDDEEWLTVVVNARVWPSLDNPVKSVEECKRVFSYDSQDPRVRVFDRPQWAERSDRRPGQPYTVFDMSTWLCMETCRRTGLFPLEVFTGSNGSHNVHEKMIAMNPGLGGFAYFNNGTCSDHVTSNIQINRQYRLGRITGLRCHEGYPGHAGNLQHEFREPQRAHASVLSYAQNNTPYFGFRLAHDPYYVNTPGNHVADLSWDDLHKLYGSQPALPPGEVPVPPIGPPIPGEMTGRALGDGTYAVDGVVGPIPAGAVGFEYIVQREGDSPIHRLIPRAKV